jgi:protein-disulfide isomerase
MHFSSRRQGPWGLVVLALLVSVAGCGNAAQSSPATRAEASNTAGEVLATVDGKAITRGEVESALGVTLAKLEEQAYQLRKQQVDELIADRLIAAEAKRRGTSVDAIVAQEITAHVAPVTEADVDAFIVANRSRIPGDPKALTGQIRAYLEHQRTTERRTAFVNTLRQKASVAVHLAPPPVFRAQVESDGFPTRGAKEAPVTIVEFSDFHCPYCRAVQPTLTQLLQKYPGKVRLVYRHLPLDGLHPQARRVAEASWCADQQQKFWAFHDQVYAAGPDGSDAALTRLATASGLDMGQYESCMASGQARASVQKDLDEGSAHGLTGTPGFFVNGRPLTGNQPLSAFTAIIDEELQAAQ